MSVVRNSVVGINILDANHLTVQHGAPANTGSERKPAAFPQGAYGIFICVIALVLIAQHKGGTISACQFARRSALNAHHGLHITGQSELLNNLYEVFHTRADGRDEEVREFL
jgi:hypothetical protein